MIPHAWLYQTHGLSLPWEFCWWANTAQILPSPSWFSWAKNLIQSTAKRVSCSFGLSPQISPFTQYLNNPHLVNPKTLSLVSYMLGLYSIINTKVTRGWASRQKKKSQLAGITCCVELVFPRKLRFSFSLLGHSLSCISPTPKYEFFAVNHCIQTQSCC